jgi:uncharacterized surface protein with fasciclin (FAS1) repeats
MITALGLIASSTSAHCGACGADKKDDHAEHTSSKTEVISIIETANNAGSFKTLLAALEAAGLSKALSGEGPFTVFAPTDEAFAALPEGTIDALLKDKEKLASILTYHVLEGAVKSDMVVKVDKAKTLNGKSVSVNVTKNKVMVDNAEVITTDIICSNGVIHVIDAVIIPDSDNEKS